MSGATSAAARRRVVVAMSGGVDSSTAALLARDEGHEVLGVTLRLWNPQAGGGRTRGKSCCSPSEVDDAARVARALGIPHYVLDYAEPFEREVIDPFVDAYLAGRTPNPCVLCNQKVKFGRLLEAACELGADWMVTGHYARIVERAGGFSLARAVDRTKDQSYFLFGIERTALARVRFPLGELGKDEVRALAARAELPVAGKPESQEICFVADRSPAAFVERQRGIDAAAVGGAIVDEAGETVGRHRGVHRFTVGQRRGLELGGGPVRYVTGLDAERRHVRVGPRAALARRELRAASATWLVERPLVAGAAVTAQIRSRHRDARCTVLDADPAGFRLRFDEPQEAVTPGQAVVLYGGDRVLGGGFIAEAD